MVNPFDAENVPLTEPDVVIQGNYTAWRKLLADIPTTGYTVAYSMGGQTVNGSHDGDSWLFEAVGAVTTAMTSGRSSRWTLIITRSSDSEQFEYSTGFVDIFATSDDRRSHAETMIAKIESLLSGRADADVSSYSIKNRSLTKMTVDELMKWRNYYREEVALTGGSTTGGPSRANNKLRARFV